MKGAEKVNDYESPAPTVRPTRREIRLLLFLICSVPLYLLGVEAAIAIGLAGPVAGFSALACSAILGFVTAYFGGKWIHRRIGM